MRPTMLRQGKRLLMPIKKARPVTLEFAQLDFQLHSISHKSTL
jgi:hypothetical protein